MNSKEFIQACEDGKLLVWGQKGLRTVRKNKDSKLIAYLDLVTGVAFICEHLEQAGENSVIMIGPKGVSIGVIPMTGWNIYGEVNE